MEGTLDDFFDNSAPPKQPCIPCAVSGKMLGFSVLLLSSLPSGLLQSPSLLLVLTGSMGHAGKPRTVPTSNTLKQYGAIWAGTHSESRWSPSPLLCNNPPCSGLSKGRSTRPSQAGFVWPRPRQHPSLISEASGVDWHKVIFCQNFQI